jgi:hypothetical protein
MWSYEDVRTHSVEILQRLKAGSLRDVIVGPVRGGSEGVGGHDACGETAFRCELEAVRAATTVRFCQQAEQQLWDDDVASANFGWGSYLDSLRLLCEAAASRSESGPRVARVGESRRESAIE